MTDTERISKRELEIAIWEGAEDIYELSKECEKLRRENLKLSKENMALKIMILKERDNKDFLKNQIKLNRALTNKINEALKNTSFYQEF